MRCGLPIVLLLALAGNASPQLGMFTTEYPEKLIRSGDKYFKFLFVHAATLADCRVTISWAS